jgi:hypothetical protein
VSLPKVSKGAARTALALVRHFFAEEIRAARRHNPGSAGHALMTTAAAAALVRAVRALEGVAGTTGTLDIPESRAARGA